MADLRDLHDKLEDLCEENGLRYYMEEGYPIVFTFAPFAYGQTSMFGDDESDHCANMQLIFGAIDNLQYKIEGDFYISDELYNKIKNMAKKIHYAFLQDWYRTKNTRFAAMTKTIWTTKAGDKMVLVDKKYAV